jgi:hypothetical protein
VAGSVLLDSGYKRKTKVERMAGVTASDTDENDGESPKSIVDILGDLLLHA